MVFPKWAIVIFSLLCIAAVGIFVFRFAVGDNLKIGDFELSKPEKVDTTKKITDKEIVYKTDTLYKQPPQKQIPQKKSFTSSPNKNVKELTGDTVIRINNSKNVNTGTNNGHIGDVVNERKLTDFEINEHVNKIRKLIQEKSLSNEVKVEFCMNSNGSLIQRQIMDALYENGFTPILGNMVTSNPVKNTWITVIDNQAAIFIGIFE